MDVGGRLCREHKVEECCTWRGPVFDGVFRLASIIVITVVRHSGECDPQDVGNVARGKDVRSDQYPVSYIIYSFNISFRLMAGTFLLHAQKKGTKEKGTPMTWPFRLPSNSICL